MAERCKQGCPAINEFKSFGVDQMDSSLYDPGICFLESVAASTENCPGMTETIEDGELVPLCQNRHLAKMFTLRDFILEIDSNGRHSN